MDAKTRGNFDGKQDLHNFKVFPTDCSLVLRRKKKAANIYQKSDEPTE